MALTRKTARPLVLLTLCLVCAGCRKRDAADTAPAGGPDANRPVAAVNGRADDNPLGEPRASIAYQLKLLQAGDAGKLKDCFTPRQKEKVTPELVASAQKTAAKMTIDDLVKTIEPGEYEGKKTAKITMKNGRTLTTLILTDGKWLSDTLWFK